MTDLARTLKKPFFNGMKDAIPIGLGYFAVSFSIGIAAKNIGMTAWQGLLMGFFNNASAGEVAGISAIAENTAYVTMALIILVTNARYILMSCTMSQKFSPNTPLYHRFLIGFDLTDELFALAVAYPGYIKPSYMYGAFTVALPMWSLGGAFGIILGNVLPVRITTALSVAAYAMLLAVVIPPCRKDKKIAAVVIASFAVSGVSVLIPLFSKISESMRVIILTVVLSVIAALVFPISDEEKGDEK